MHRHPLRQALRLPQAALKRLVTGLLQLVLLANRPARLARSGFVLPTTVMLVLMVVLTVTALTYRSFTRSDMAISQREQQAINNAATPAIDRAKAKIEFLFRSDPRFPAGVPSSDVLADLMLPSYTESKGKFVGFTGRVPVLPGANKDPYTLPGETRVDINSDSVLDNAWSFTGNNNETVVYSILVDDQVLATEKNDAPKPANPLDAPAYLGRPYVTNDLSLTAASPTAKAKALITRTGPLATTEAVPQCQGAISEGGWQIVAQTKNATLQKNFQINAFVANKNAANRTFETLEFQQSRIASRASKWGAWFRYDLEIHPGPDFKWNGAMHTDGSLKLDGAIQPFMISSFNSCLYTKEAAELTLGTFDNDGAAGVDITKAKAGAVGDFQGQVIVAKTSGDTYTNATIQTHVFNGAKVAPTNESLTKSTDSVAEASSNPSDVAMNPLLLYTQEKESHIDPTTWKRDADWGKGKFVVENKERIKNELIARPFVDDLFRADNRWGPKPRYNSNPDFDLTAKVNVDKGLTVGDKIDDTLASLISSDTGFDGYWERRSIATGLRLIVGERLQLGNTNIWGNNPAGAVAATGDPLYPHTTLKNTSNNVNGGALEHLQRRSLRDNLAAVQSMAIYHYEGGGMATDGKFPMACYALTAHPGTSASIINSRTFKPYANITNLRTDFLTGNGTNGWEFRYPDSFDTVTEFRGEVLASQPLGKALRNLAYFAGDPNGGAPSFKPVQDTVAHPYPYQAMWGDFSPLRRIVLAGDLDTAAKYDALSFADQSTVHTAACTLSMLAYNVSSDYASAVQGATQSITKLQAISGQLTASLTTVMDCLEASDTNNGTKTATQRANACKSGNFDAAPFLKANNDIKTDGTLGWTDASPNTVLPAFSYTKKNGTKVTAASPCPASTDKAGFQAACDSADYFAGWSMAKWIDFIKLDNVFNAKNLTVAEKAALADDLVAFSKSYSLLNSVIRDRDLGFKPGLSAKAGLPFDDGLGSFVAWDYSSGLAQPLAGYAQGNTTRSFKLGCNPNIFQGLVSTGGGGQDNVLTLGLIACSNVGIQPIRYPSLYYLFPTNAHGHTGADYHVQPAAEEYITQVSNYKVNDSVTYSIVGADEITGVADIAAVPKKTDLSDWVVPHGSLASSTANPIFNPNTDSFKIAVGTSIADVAFLDKGIYNGRELLSTRVLDIDLAALTKNAVGTGKDKWFSANRDKGAEGVVYAFREDAVREDEIVRPKKSTATVATCTALDKKTGSDTRLFAIETNTNCQVSLDPTTPQDPPLTDQRISLKPVDFLPDPQRRVHGFRLRTADGTPADFSAGGRQVGMTFISDSGVYIMGDFNPHSSDGSVAAGSLLEEFTQKITDKNFTFDNFYKDRTALNTTSFANLSTDHWRPVEILSEAIYVLSSNFVDGAVADTVTTGASSSYANQPRTDSGGTLTANWVQENPADAGSPLFVDRNGTYYYKDPSKTPPNVAFFTQFDNSGGTKGPWTRVQDNKPLMAAKKTYVNAVFVGGISPSRPNQGYGGLHNYPRFLETWDGQDLFIQGSFIQLNFTTSNTAPFEQEGLEPGGIPNTAELIAYYAPPNRRWGYDVGLLYVPPAPAARRFVVIGSPRSEYYRELASDDPYIVNLRCAQNGAGQKIMADICPS